MIRRQAASARVEKPEASLPKGVLGAPSSSSRVVEVEVGRCGGDHLEVKVSRRSRVGKLPQHPLRQRRGSGTVSDTCLVSGEDRQMSPNILFASGEDREPPPTSSPPTEKGCPPRGSTNGGEAAEENLGSTFIPRWQCWGEVGERLVVTNFGRDIKVEVGERSTATNVS